MGQYFFVNKISEDFSVELTVTLIVQNIIIVYLLIDLVVIVIIIVINNLH